MKHPQVLLLPLLMLSDYFLTVLGAAQSEKGYRNHFRMQHYELNPLWQQSISRKKWFNPRHIALTAIVSCGTAGLLEVGDLTEPVAEAILGCLLVFFAMLVGRHLSNILVFRRFAKRPDEVSGQVSMAHSLMLAISAYQFLVAAVPLALLAVLSPTPFTLGAAVGGPLVLFVHGIWAAQKDSGNPKPPIAGEKGQPATPNAAPNPPKPAP